MANKFSSEINILIKDLSYVIISGIFSKLSVIILILIYVYHEILFIRLSPDTFYVLGHVVEIASLYYHTSLFRRMPRTRSGREIRS